MASHRAMAALAALSLFAFQMASAQSAQPVSPNSVDGLERLLREAVGAAKNNDAARLSGLLREMEIPNYTAWFPYAFGPQQGAGMAESYGKLLDKHEREFETFLGELAREDEEVSAIKMSSIMQRTQYSTIRRTLDFYYATSKKPGAPANAARTPVGYFVYLDGMFRWVFWPGAVGQRTGSKLTH